MKHSTPRQLIRAVLFGALASALAVACAPSESRFDTKTYRIPYPDSQGVYALREIELKTFSEPQKFRGDAAQVYVEPTDSGGQLAGEEPVGRFIQGSDGVIVPADFVSMQATTVYAHMERLKEIDEKIGVASSVRWPLKIGVQTNVVDRGQGLKNNAVYDGRLDALLIVPYTGAGLPIAMNAGVLAHEHFHTIFQSLVLSKVKDKSVVVGKPGSFDSLLARDCEWAKPPVSEDEMAPVPEKPIPSVAQRVPEGDPVEKAAEEMPKRTYNGFILRALNEGMADFWGWVYTGDYNFIELSLPSEGGVRRLDFDSGRLPDSKSIRASLVDLRREDKVRSQEQRVTLSYILGTQYARFLRATAIEMTGEKFPSLEARLAVAQTILETLPAIAVTAATEYDHSFLSPNFILKPLTLKMGKLSAKACERLEKFKTRDESFDMPASCPKKPSKPSNEDPEVEGAAS